MEGDPAQRPTTKQPAVRGFTLIELLVVIAIIAVLMAISSPYLRAARNHGQRVVCMANLRGI
jgi:prepilin-type N-terminal cleavage/methylation domain-containing protein